MKWILTFAATALSCAVSGQAVAEGGPWQQSNLDMTCTVIRPEGERGAVVPETWPGGVVPYEFDGGVSSANRTRVRDAMDLLEEAAGVTFVPRTNESNRLLIGGFGGNWSHVGMSGGQQSLSIYNWTSPFIICHELNHAMGRHHQQCRTDRDDYIQVNWDNIDTNYAYNYYISNSDEVGPYDFESIMHYSQWGFSTGGPTMTCLAGYEQWQNVMGQRNYLSDGDVATMQFMYPVGTPDASVLFAQATPDQVEAGESVHVVSVLKNVGDQTAFDAVGSVYLSVDDTIGAGDVLLVEEVIAYILPGEVAYFTPDVLVPAATADGAWNLIVQVSGGSDADGGNNHYAIALHVGPQAACEGDFNGDEAVDVNDILMLVAAFGDCNGCDEDLDGDGVVGVDDLLVAIAAWGPCP
ncbi:MAG: M12 family metallopeptidase [Phycisphaerales bacterium]|jgi:hypothetical protein|nr:M12 family metallopeptidase [Phycisphaerales bacterium]